MLLVVTDRPTAEALRRAALLGDEFALGDLATVLGCSASTLVPAVEEAMTTGILAATGAVLVFRHPLIRQALYDGMPAPVRAALHLEAAQALATACAPPDRVAEQLAATPSTTAVSEEHRELLAIAAGNERESAA